MISKEKNDYLSCHLQDFFYCHLINQRNVSSQTIASYSDTFRLLLKYMANGKKKKPVDLKLSDLNAPVILKFLDYLEKERGNCIRSRNVRLAAIRSFMNYLSFKMPDRLSAIKQVLAISMKRFDKPILDYLSKKEIQAVISSLDKKTWSGYRDFIMFSTFYNTGARTSEIINLKIQDVLFENNRKTIRIFGKGRKERVIPLWTKTAIQLKEYIKRLNANPESPLFPNRKGKSLTRSGVEYRLKRAVKKALINMPSLNKRRISPHTFRHTTAMHLLQSGVDITVIALWLGHESPVTTHMYVEADLQMKEQALKKIQPLKTKTIRYQPSDPVIAFLESL